MGLGEDITAKEKVIEDGYPYTVEVDFNRDVKDLEEYMLWIFHYNYGKGKGYRMYFPQYEVVGFGFKDANEAMFFKLRYA